MSLSTYPSSIFVILQESNSPENYVNNLKIALDKMKEEIPRAFVNVKAMLDITPLYNMTEETGWCDFMHE